MAKRCSKTGKKCFFTVEDAQIRCEEINLESDAVEMRVYKCEFCKKYHLTSMTDEETMFDKKNRQHIKDFNKKKNIEKKNNNFMRQYDVVKLKDLLQEKRKLVVEGNAINRIQDVLNRTGKQ